MWLSKTEKIEYDKMTNSYLMCLCTFANPVGREHTICCRSRNVWLHLSLDNLFSGICAFVSIFASVCLITHCGGFLAKQRPTRQGRGTGSFLI